MDGSDKRQIAERIRALVGGLDAASIAAAAERVRVEASALRAAIDEETPYPTLEVLGAVVRAYGVDPNWLITGAYDAGIHRQALEAEPAAIEVLLQGIIESRTCAGDASSGRGRRIGQDHSAWLSE